MSVLIAGLILFLGAHAVSIVAPAWRDRVVARIGKLPWQGIYSVIAIAGLVLIVQGYAASRGQTAVLYQLPRAIQYLTMLLMLPVFPLLLATYLPGRIKTVMRHPMLAATKFWALAHLLANGTVADVVLFGSVLAWAVADRISLKRRPSRPAASLPAGRWNDLIAIVAGLAIYVGFFLGLHRWLVGMPLAVG